jgi:predicted RND superfamily exporter protein
MTPAVWAVWVHVVAGLVCALGLLRLETSADTRVFYGDNAYHQDLKNFEAKFQQNNNILVLLRFEGERLTDSPALVSAIRTATAAGWRLPYVLRVESLATHPHVINRTGEFELKPVLDVVCDERCADPASVLADPVLVGRLVSADTTTVGIYLAFDLPFASPTAVQTITQAVRGLAEQLRQDTPGLTVAFVGGITMMDAFNEAAQRDAALLVPLVLVVMSIVLVVFIGELKLVGLLLATGVYGAIVAMGVAGWLGIQINAATSIAGVIVITLTVASGLHLMVSFLRQRVRVDVPAEVAVRIAVDLNWRPMLLTTATTLIGLLSMNFADSPPLGQLGNLVTIGLCAATSALLLVVPVLLGRIRNISVVTRKLPIAEGIRWLAARSGNGLAIVILALIAFAIAGVQRISINDDFVQYFDSSFEFRRGADFAQAHLGGPNYIDIEIRANEADGIYDPQYLGVVAALTQWLRAQPLVANAVSVADVVADLSEAFTGDRDVRRLDRGEIAQFLLTYELSLTAGQDLEDFLDKGRSTTRLSTLLAGGDSQAIIELEDQIYAWFAEHAPEQYGIVVTGINVPVAHTSLLNAASMLKGLLGSLVLIAVILGLYFRSIRMVLLTLPAIFLPIAMGFGLWGWLVGEIGLASSVIAAMTIGIIIDDAIHIIYRYRHARATLNEPPASAAQATITTVGLAIVATSVALAAGFMLLGLSGFEINRSLGLCTTFIVLSGLCVHLLLMPRVLVWIDDQPVAG